MATLVTGLGYLGSALARRLRDDGERVIAIENFFSTPKEMVSPLLAGDGIELIEGSISDPMTIRRAFREDSIHSVFHLAAQASARTDAASLAYTQETNFTGTRLLLDACRDHGVNRIVLASSMRLYRAPLPRVLSERWAVDPPDLVHLSQLYGEVLLGEHRRREPGIAGDQVGDRRPKSRAFSGVAARLGIVHGLSPVMKNDPRFLAVPQLFCLQAAAGDALSITTGPRSELAFVHIDDAIEALVRCRGLTKDVNVVNVGCEVRSVASVAEVVRIAALGRGVEIHVEYQGRAGPERSRIIESRLTGFTPSVGIEESIGDVLDHYLLMRAQRCASS